MQIAFYKGKGDTFDKLIKWWTNSPYSHVELIVDGVWYSSSTRDGGVRSRIISGTSGNWDVYDLTGFDKYHALNYFHERHLKKYDWLGIALTQVVPLGIHNQNRYFCSELIAGMLGIKDPVRHSPQDLYKKLNLNQS